MANQDVENHLKHFNNIQMLIEKLRINGGMDTKARKQLY
jgi:hypothetical protein